MTVRHKALAILTATVMAVAGEISFGQTGATPEITQAAELLQANPASRVNRTNLASLYYMQGIAAAGNGQHGAAIQAYRAGLDIAIGQATKLAPGDPVVQVLRYGAGYSLYSIRQYEQSAAMLEPLAAEFLSLPRARYLLGLSLMRSPRLEQWRHGLDVLGNLAAESSPPLRDLALRTGARWAYLRGIELSIDGRFDSAAALADAFLKNAPVDTLGEDETIQHFLYAAGYFYRNAGNGAAAAFAYEKLYQLNEEYTLANGLTLSAVLANAYYQAALDVLPQGDPTILRQAIKWLNDAEETSSVSSADVNHGKAIAYMKLGPSEARNAAREVEAMRRKDVAYFRGINRAR